MLTEIANLLHISQPTISRDIYYIKKEIRKSAENYSEHLFEIYRNTMLGLDETIKKLWATIDSPRRERCFSEQAQIMETLLVIQLC